MSSLNKKPLPKFNSDAEAEKFLAEANLTDYDLFSFKPVQFEIKPKKNFYRYGRI